jgi:phage tail-like protein
MGGAAVAAGRQDEYAVSFRVAVDNNALGLFDSCEGLGCKVETHDVSEGGNNTMVWHLPTRITYTNVTLSRAVSADSSKIMEMFSRFSSRGMSRSTAVIEALTLDGRIIAKWSLAEVIPVGWTGPQLNLDSSRVATEKLELAYNGFLPSTA